jgi:hypothetical protein
MSSARDRIAELSKLESSTFACVSANTVDRCLMVASIASAAASQFVQKLPQGIHSSLQVLSGYSILAPYPAFSVPLKAV